jgi:hypothetical protein
MRAGTREFRELDGALEERWVADTSRGADGNRGRIELAARYVSTRVADVEEGVE